MVLPDVMSWMISIHALREEGDLWTFAGVFLRNYFYPRPP